jgi:hypothetical protein
VGERSGRPGDGAPPGGAVGRARANPPARFPGYGRPRFTQTPNLFFDEQMQDLGLSELRALLYIFRRTFGFQQDGAEIRLQDFLDGRRAADGRRLDRGAGVAASSLTGALGRLEQQGLIFRHAQRDAARGNLPTYYELNIDGQRHCTPACLPGCDPSAPPPERRGEGIPETWGEGGAAIGGEALPDPRGDLSIDERKNPERKVRPPAPARAELPAHVRHSGVGEEPGAPVDHQTRPAVAAGGAARIAADTQLLHDAGLDAETAAACARLAALHQRPAEYVAEQIAYVGAAPGLQSPLAVLVANLKRNVRRLPPTETRRAASVAGHPPRPTPAALLAAAPSGGACRPTDLPAPDAGVQAELDRCWRAALVLLRTGLPAEAYRATLQYARLLELDRAAGWALLGLPTDFMRDQVAGALGDAIGGALSSVCQAPIRVVAATLPGQGPLAPPLPTLAAILAARGRPDPGGAGVGSPPGPGAGFTPDVGAGAPVEVPPTLAPPITRSPALAGVGGRRET